MFGEACASRVEPATRYDVLNVPRDASAAEIRAAYRSLSQKHHPDRNRGDARSVRVMTALNGAYEMLSDPAKRLEHDAWIAEEEIRIAGRSAPRSARPAAAVDTPLGPRVRNSWRWRAATLAVLAAVAALAATRPVATRDSWIEQAWDQARRDSSLPAPGQAADASTPGRENPLRWETSLDLKRATGTPGERLY